MNAANDLLKCCSGDQETSNLQIRFSVIPLSSHPKEEGLKPIKGSREEIKRK